MKQNQLPVQDSPKELAVYAAVLQLAGQGVDLASLRVQQIADAAGMGKGTLYEYFRSKEEILLGTIFYVARQELEYLEALAKNCESFTALSDASLQYIRELIDQRAASYLMVASSSAPTTPSPCQGRELFAAELARLDALLRTYMEKGKACGQIRQDCDFGFFSYTVITACLSYAHALMAQSQAAQGGPAPTLSAQDAERYTLTLLQKAFG